MLNDSNDTPRSGDQVVRSLVRGLDVLVCVNEHTPVGISQIVRHTALPKATVIRLLSTLRQAGYIAQQAGTGLYEPLPAVRRLSSAWQPDDTFLTEAAHLLDAFGQRVSWPAELMMAESAAMTIRASNRNTSPIGLRMFEQTRFPVLRSAGGLAWLAALPLTEREKTVIELSENETGPGSAHERAAAAFAAIEQTQRQGYSVHAYRAPVPGLRAIGMALPMAAPRRSPGALVLLTLESVVSMEQLTRELIGELRQCAQELARLHTRDNP